MNWSLARAAVLRALVALVTGRWRSAPPPRRGVPSWRMIKAAIVLAVIASLVVAYAVFKSPHMRVQPHLRAFQREMPALPAAAIPLQDLMPTLPSASAAAAMHNPLQPTSDNLARGAVYYSYYCLACHGDNGKGDGPVGESYVPRPTDLRAATIRAYSDGKLLYAMLAGVGHEPVLSRVVWPEHRWPLVLYVHRLAEGKAAPPPLPPSRPGHLNAEKQPLRGSQQ